MTEPLLTARQVADRLAVSPETVLRWTRRGELPGFRLPSGAIRYRADQVDTWLAGYATAVETRADAADRGSGETPEQAAPAAQHPTGTGYRSGWRDTRSPLAGVVTEEDHYAR